METITNVAGTVTSAASKAIWGENDTATTATNETGGLEPISGQQGKGTASEPYDQGNSENPTSTSNLSNTSEKPITSIVPDSSNSKSTAAEPSTASTTSTGNSANIPSVDPIPIRLRDQADKPESSPKVSNTDSTHREEHPDKVTTSRTHEHTEKPATSSNAESTDSARPQDKVDKPATNFSNMSTNTTANNQAPTNASDTPSAAPDVGARPYEKQQGAPKPNDAPDAKQTEAIEETKDKAEELLKKKDPNDHSGEPMKVHDGPEEDRRESKAGQEGGGKHGSSGTGEQWVKTSGVAADGGDFDATKPGAGREADRLLEQKGIQRAQPGQPTPPAGEHSNDSNKPGMGQKIKEKLHIGHKK